MSIRDFEQRLLRKNHTKGIPTTVLYLDTETLPVNEGIYQVHYMRLGWTCYCRYSSDSKQQSAVWKEWKSPKDLCDYIQQIAYPGNILYIFAHNVYFDLQASGFYKYLAEAGWILDFIYDKGYTYILSIHKDKQKIKCISTTNFFETKLSGLGKLVGLKKLDIDWRTKDIEKLSTYCKRDVEIIKLAMEQYFRFLVDNNMGKFCLSKASQSMRVYRHRFMNNKIYLHREEDVIALERSAYFGGRVECFQLGKLTDGPFVSLDVNSMYPYVMKTHYVPVRLIDHRKNVSLKLVKDILKTFLVVAKVTVKTDQPIYPYRKDQKLLFPIGEYETSMCSYSLAEALKRKHIKKIHEVAVYEKAIIFKRFVEVLYMMRQKYISEGEQTWEYLVKKILNSLYGKWAQRRPKIDHTEDITYSGYWRDEIFDMVTGTTETTTKLFNKLFVIWGDEPDRNSFTAISAHITDGSRMLLWKYIEAVGLDRMLYCDTDSLKIRQKDVYLVEKYLSKTELGKLKIEDVSDILEIRGPKTYWADDKRRIKGVPYSAKRISEDTWKYTQFLKQPTHLRHRKPMGVFTKEVLKTLNYTYDKGIVHSDGKVTPLILS